MAERIHLIVDEYDKARYRRAAAREGKSLSEWLREAAGEKLAASAPGRPLDTPEALNSFFQACDDREPGTEPDWEAHRAVIERSLARGAAGS